MCIAVVLLFNSFYSAYYHIIDLCHHVFISLAILIIIFICLTPVLFSLQTDSAPLYTIIFLVCGVVVGLAAVIFSMCIYRQCLQKKQPLTTTPKPEDKREHLRDTRPGICRPLTLGHGPEAVIEQAAGELTTSSYPPVIVATSCLDETDGHQQIAENEEEIEAPDFEVVAEPRKRRQLPSIEHLKGNSLEEERESLLKSAENEDTYRQRRESLVKMHRTSITEWTMPVVVGGVQQQQRRVPIGGETFQYLAVHPLPRQALSFDERISRRDQRRNSEYTDLNVWSRMGYSQDPSMRDVSGDDAYDQYHQRAQIQTSLQSQNRPTPLCGQPIAVRPRHPAMPFPSRPRVLYPNQRRESLTCLMSMADPNQGYATFTNLNVASPKVRRMSTYDYASNLLP